MPSPSKTIRGDTVIIGDRSMEALAAEFAGLTPDTFAQTPPPGSATLAQLAQIWGLRETQTRRRVADLVRGGKLKLAGVYRVQNGARGVYPLAHYVRVR